MRKGKGAFFKCLLMLTFCGIINLANAAMVEAWPTISAAASGGVSLRVLWTVSGYYIGRNSAWGEQEAKGLLFKSLDITSDQIIFNGRVCKGVHFKQKTVETADYLRDVWQVTPQEVGIEDREIQVVQTNCRLTGFQEYLRLSDHRLVVPINGVLFYFEPVLAR